MTPARRFNIVIIFLVIFGSAILPADGWGQAPRTAKIAFTSFRGGNDEIYVMDADGTNQRNLTNHAGGDYSPAWSPYGRRIAFYSSRPEGTGLYLMNADGTNQRFLTSVGQGDPPAAWSPDGKKIAFTWEVEGLDGVGLEGVGDGMQSDIAVIDADGGIPRNLTNHPGQDKCPSWSPDGKQIAFYASGRNGIGIFVMNSDGSNQRRLTLVNTGDLYPDWSPDGKKIVFESSKPGGKLDIYVMNADGTNRRRLTKHPEHDRHAAWSPDSQSIIFYSERDGQSGEIYVMDANGNNQRNLTNHPAPDGFYARSSWFDPAFALSVSPTGKHIDNWGGVKKNNAISQYRIQKELRHQE